ncbi:proteasome maturation factor UMP1 [Pterulicium gracile]|uniref:Proteasome maturation factor UMP1 n=1 Tax=Pterulicium gracile TaxID=1884261 RepID=A0A5C3QXV7_9AGAR|nr:proteasome maturation factor UMP1 [Pterula gracilis]
MESSLRLVPKGASKSASINDTAGSLGLHDTLQYGPRSLATEVSASSNDFQDRLAKWEETQDNLKLTLQRNLYGLHVPMRIMMERKAVMHNPHMPAAAQSNIHLDILMGRDGTIHPSDVFGGLEGHSSLSIHQDMERMLKL